MLKFELLWVRYNDIYIILNYIMLENTSVFEMKYYTNNLKYNQNGNV